MAAAISPSIVSRTIAAAAFSVVPDGAATRSVDGVTRRREVERHPPREEMAGVDVAEDEVGVGNGRFGAALSVAGGAGIVPPRSPAPPRARRLLSTRAMLPPPAPMDSTPSIGMASGTPSTVGRGSHGGCSADAKATSRLVPPMSAATTCSAPVSCAMRHAPSTAAAGPDCNVSAATVFATRAQPPLA